MHICAGSCLSEPAETRRGNNSGTNSHRAQQRSPAFVEHVERGASARADHLASRKREASPRSARMRSRVRVAVSSPISRETVGRTAATRAGSAHPQHDPRGRAHRPLGGHVLPTSPTVNGHDPRPCDVVHARHPFHWQVSRPPGRKDGMAPHGTVWRDIAGSPTQQQPLMSSRTGWAAKVAPRRSTLMAGQEPLATAAPFLRSPCWTSAPRGRALDDPPVDTLRWRPLWASMAWMHALPT